MKKKNLKKYGLIALVLVLVGIVFYFGIQQSVLGISNELKYKTPFHNQDLATGSYISEATLNLPKNTSQFAFVVNYDVMTYSTANSGGIDIKYELFNYQTNSWETIHQKTWSLSGGNSHLQIDGTNVYVDGIPEHIASNIVSSCVYDKVAGCLNEMTIEEAKTLNAWIEGKCSYTYRCIYPDEYILDHSYNDNDWGDLVYFPPLLTFDTKYINDNQALFKISVNSRGQWDSFYSSDFGIDLFKVETPQIETFSYISNSTECASTNKFTYQILTTDYYTEEECEYQNNLTECYLPEHCLEGYECQNKNCILSPEEETPITGDVIGEEPKEINIPMIFMYSMIAIAVLGIIIVVIKRRK